MTELQIKPNEQVALRVQLASTDIGLYPQTIIYDEADDSVVDTVNLAHVSSGLYVGRWTNNGIKKRYYTQTIIYTDSYGGTESPIDRPDSDSLNIGYFATGGVFGSARGSTKVVSKDLTDKEIKKIIDGVVKELKPLIDEKSSFNPETDMVKTDINIDLTPALDKMDDVINNMGDKDILTKVNKITETQDKTNSSMVKMADNIIIANKKIKSTLKDSLSDTSTNLSSLMIEQIDKMNPEEINKECTETVQQLKNLISHHTDNLDSLDKAFDQVKVFVGGSMVGKNTQTEKELFPEIIEDLESGASALDIYYKIKKLPNKEKDKVLRLIKSKYPGVLKKLLSLTK